MQLGRWSKHRRELHNHSLAGALVVHWKWHVILQVCWRSSIFYTGTAPTTWLEFVSLFWIGLSCAANYDSGTEFSNRVLLFGCWWSMQHSLGGHFGHWMGQPVKQGGDGVGELGLGGGDGGARQALLPGRICLHRLTWACASNIAAAGLNWPIVLLRLTLGQEDKCSLPQGDLQQLRIPPPTGCRVASTSALLCKGLIRIGLPSTMWAHVLHPFSFFSLFAYKFPLYHFQN